MAMVEIDRPHAAGAIGAGHASVSLRGAGRIQRRVWHAFMVHPDEELTTADLVAWAYPRWTGEPLRNQRLAIRRAAAKVAMRVRRDRPGGVVFRAFGSNSVANRSLSADDCESIQ